MSMWRSTPWPPAAARDHRRMVAGAGLAAVTLLLSLLMAPHPASAASGPIVLSATKAGPAAIPARRKTVARMALPAGRWFVTAKALLIGTKGSASHHLGVDCRLVVGKRNDQVHAAPTGGGVDGSRVPLLLTLAARLASSGQARLRCAGELGGFVSIRDMRLSALRAGTLTTRESVFPAKTTGSGKPRIISARGKGTTQVPGDGFDHTVGLMDIPAGAWWIVAKAVAIDGNTATSQFCRLSVGADEDEVRFHLGSDGEAGDAMPLALQLVHSLDAGGIAVVECRGAFAFSVRNVVITAIGAGRLTSRELPGGASSTVGSGAPRIISGWSDGPLAVAAGSGSTIVSALELPRGRWMVLAKLWFLGDAVPVDGTVRRLLCRLGVGGRADGIELRYQNNITRVAPVVLSLVYRSDDPEVVVLRCRRPVEGGTGEVIRVRTTALKAR